MNIYHLDDDAVEWCGRTTFDQVCDETDDLDHVVYHGHCHVVVCDLNLVFRNPAMSSPRLEPSTLFQKPAQCYQVTNPTHSKQNFTGSAKLLRTEILQ